MKKHHNKHGPVFRSWKDIISFAHEGASEAILTERLRLPRDGIWKMPLKIKARMPRDRTLEGYLSLPGYATLAKGFVETGLKWPGLPRDGTLVHNCCRMPRDWISKVPRDWISKVPRDWISKVPHDWISRMPRDWISRMPRDWISRVPRDWISRMPRDWISRMPRDWISRMPRDWISRMPRDWISKVPRDWISKVPRDWICSVPRDWITKAPRDWISRMPRDATTSLEDCSDSRVVFMMKLQTCQGIHWVKKRSRWRNQLMGKPVLRTGNGRGMPNPIRRKIA